MGEEDKNKDVKKEIKPIKEFLGVSYEGFKGQKAVEKLLQEKKGHVPDAFHREDIGDITLAWGDTLSFNKTQREEDNIDIGEFISDFSELVKKGEIYQNKSSFSRVDVWYKGKMAILETMYDNKSLIGL
jgi:hypothetical protein